MLSPWHSSRFARKVLFVVLCSQLILALGAVTAAGQAETGPIPSSYFGMTLMFPTDWPTAPVGALGKATMFWPYLEPSKGQYNWSRLDNFVQAAQAHGTPGFFFTNDYVPQWAAADPSTCRVGSMETVICTSTVANIKDWDDFVIALVTRYKGQISFYELWNEPDNPTEYSGTIDQLVTLTTHYYNIVRSLDPNALIGSPSANDDHYLDSYWAAGGVKTVDVVTLHGYPGASNPVAETICAFRTVPLKQIMAKHGAWGGNTTLGDPDLQAAFLARHFILHWACGVSRYYWNMWDGQVQRPYWGMLWTSSAGMNPAGIAFENVEFWLSGSIMPNGCLMNAKPIPPPPYLFHGVYTCDLTRPGGYQAQAVWNTDGSSSYAVPSQFIQYRDSAGNTYPIPSNQQVAIGLRPILLEN
jgi:hypothetical protein